MVLKLKVMITAFNFTTVLRFKIYYNREGTKATNV